MEASLQACSLACPEGGHHTDHAGDASSLAAEVACLAVGALCRPRPPLREQLRGPDQVLVKDAGNGVTGPSFPPVRYPHQGGSTY